MGAYDTIRWRNLIGRPLSFDNPDSTGNQFVDWTVPMNMFEEHHDNNEKILPDGDTIPAGQTGLQDIDNAIDWLFKHPNVGPFISTRLIQQFVKSNPSPEYVNRVATVFNNNGNNERGDLGAVILAILTDSEARDCQWINNPQSGKLLQPLERYLNLFMALEIETPSGDFLFHDSFNPGENRYIQQAFLSSPSVFNFFSPFYVVQPYPYKNFTGVDKNARDTLLIAQNINDKPTLQFDDYRTTYNTQGIDDLIDDLDVLLCRGQLHPNIKTLIRNNVIKNLKEGNLSKTEDIVKDVIYYIMASPSYAILK